MAENTRLSRLFFVRFRARHVSRYVRISLSRSLASSPNAASEFTVVRENPDCFRLSNEPSAQTERRGGAASVSGLFAMLCHAERWRRLSFPQCRSLAATSRRLLQRSFLPIFLPALFRPSVRSFVLSPSSSWGSPERGGFTKDHHTPARRAIQVHPSGTIALPSDPQYDPNQLQLFPLRLRS